MAKFYDALTPALTEFINAQHVFFVGSAAAEGRVNVSPKGTDTLRVLDDRKVGYLDITGSGNETAAHVAQSGRLTIMFCAFVGKPKILRLYGEGHIVPRGSSEWDTMIDTFGDRRGSRQIVLLDVDSLQTSCGFGVPILEFAHDRDEMDKWAERKGPDGVTKYWSDRNRESIDGFPTGIEQQT